LESPQPIDAELIGVISPAEYLFETRDFSILNESIATLTNYEPVVNVFDKDEHVVFGIKGQGPGEFQNPSKISMSKNMKVGVMDFPAPNNIKLARFSMDGQLESEEMLREIGTIGSFSFINGEEIVAFTGEFMNNKYSLIHYDGFEYKKIFEFETEQIEIIPEIGPVPRITISKPYVNTFTWAPYSDDQIAIWKGNNKIEIVDLDGELQKIYSFDLQKFELTNSLITSWIDRNYPEDRQAFGHQNFNIGIRKALQEDIEFPKYLPVILEIKKDVSGEGVWIRRTPKSEGQKWSLLTENGIIKTTKFPSGRSVIGFSENYAYASFTDEDGFDNIEKYKP